ncbi:MAG: bifunctional DNA-formamidopyrimidine glycosylase/DNA-(apurinic or apyrimidinic site) lyase [Betaproteobacteria bacterium]|nr:bifunctional DNA-formamidopyrimidine glycosylase/DNA-(apurinic or apyrimidinic site) lyase [Betaproteobacteria bacterium]
MPELPEVEVTRRGVAAHIEGRCITKVVIRRHDLRWPVPRELPAILPGLRVKAVNRRAKYLLLDCEQGWLIVHLGMSGSLRIIPTGTAAAKHDHFDLEFGGELMRLRDPRRFGAVLWTQAPPEQHELIAHLGPEPFSAEVSGKWLHGQLRGRTAPIKNLLMDSRILVGVGNIYANEALFRSGIRPSLAGRKLSVARCGALVETVRATLSSAIEAGGSTLRDFTNTDGSSGYFQQSYFVYDRHGEPCRVCGAPVKLASVSQRSTFYCPRCQR